MAHSALTESSVSEDFSIIPRWRCARPIGTQKENGDVRNLEKALIYFTGPSRGIVSGECKMCNFWVVVHAKSTLYMEVYAEGERTSLYLVG